MTSDSPPSVFVPCTRPRRELMSPITSPWYADGTRTVSSETGSSTTTPALDIASLKPTEAAVRNAISEESTLWYLPS